MRKKIINTIWLTTIAITLSLGYAMLFFSESKLLTFINIYFIIGLFSLSLGLVIYVVEGGFFTFFSSSYKKFLKSIGISMFNRQHQIEEDIVTEHSNFSLKMPLILVGATSILLTFTISVLIY